MAFYNKQTFSDALKNLNDVTELNIPAQDLNKCLKFNNLEVLNISYGDDYILPKELAKLPKLHTINLGSFPKEFPAFFTEMKQLKHLQFPHFYLYYGKIDNRTLFLDIFDKLDSLESLTISFTFYETPEVVNEQATHNSYSYTNKTVLAVPNSIFQMKNLKKLDININHMENLPKDAFLGLKNIEELSLGYGSITQEMQENIFSLKNLKKLTFNGNFVYLKAEMAQRTRFEVFSEKIINLKKLESLSIINSKITEIPAFFQKLTQLQELDFSNNDIKVLPFLLSDMPHLTKLVLNGNKKLLIDNIFVNKNNLSDLKLIACNLKSIPDSIFNSQKLEYLNLYANKLNFLSEKILELPNLWSIDIDKNPFCKTTELKTSTTVNNLLASFKKRTLPIHLQKLELSLIQNRIEIVKNAKKEDLLACLYVANAPIRRNALIALENHIKTPFSLKLDKKTTLISVLGDVAGVKITTLTNFFKEKEYKIISKITDKTTHICIGEQPKIALETILEMVSKQKIALVLPKHLKDFQQLLEKPYLLDVSEDMTQNIADLLKSENADNQQLAMQMMDVGGIPDEILYLLVLMVMGNAHNYFSANFKDKSQKIRQLLAKYAPSNLLAAVEKYYRKGTDNGIKLLLNEEEIDRKALLKAGLDYFYVEEVKHAYENHYYNIFFNWGLKEGGEYVKLIFAKHINGNTLHLDDAFIQAKYVFVEELLHFPEVDTIKVNNISGLLTSNNINIPHIKKMNANSIPQVLEKKLNNLLPQMEIDIYRAAGHEH